MVVAIINLILLQVWRDDAEDSRDEEHRGRAVEVVPVHRRAGAADGVAGGDGQQVHQRDQQQLGFADWGDPGEAGEGETTSIVPQ